jgi:hypothetical protein
MTTARRKSKKPAVEYDYLTVTVDHYDLSTSAGINYESSDRRYQYDDTPIYDFSTSVELAGICQYPADREGHRVYINVYGDSLNRFMSLNATLRDYHVKDEAGDKKYRKRGGIDVPIYDPPDSIGYIEKIRGEAAWRGNIWVSTHLVNDMLSLLVQPKQLYLAIHEVKENRRRRIRSLSLQTSDPAE